MLPLKEIDMLNILHYIIKASLKILTLLMAFVIIWEVANVAWMLYMKIVVENRFLDTDSSSLFSIFGDFLTVLIAVEIFVNIALYLKDNFIHVKLVAATALMAIARKIIIMDYDKIDPPMIFASGCGVLALGITLWLINDVNLSFTLKKNPKNLDSEESKAKPD